MADLTKKIVSDKDEIWIGGDNVVRIRIFEGVELEEEDLVRQFECYKSLGINENALQRVMVDATLGFTIIKEARDLTAKQTRFYFKAAAVVTHSLSTRIIINFLSSFYNIGLPIKLFSDEEEALKWLAKYK